MKKNNSLKMITAISNAHGAPGFEEEVAKELKKLGEDLGDTKIDNLNNVYIYRKKNSGNKLKVQLDAHSDEVGFMVQAIRLDGNLRIIPLGSWVTSNVPGHKVMVRNGKGEYITGIVASKPPHYMSETERKAAIDFYNITVDVGATSKEEAEKKFFIRIGEPVVPYAPFEYDESNDLMIGKAFDCRLGCVAIIDTLKALENEEIQVDVIGACCVQEEVGIRGSKVTSNKVKPDVAIVFEGCPADDTCAETYMVQTAIKKGPMLRHIDAGMITNPRFQRFAIEVAKECDIEIQEGVRSGGSTNGANIHLSNLGVPTIVIGIPVRYIHTHYGIASYGDYKNSVKLAVEILKKLDNNNIENF